MVTGKMTVPVCKKSALAPIAGATSGVRQVQSPDARLRNVECSLDRVGRFSKLSIRVLILPDECRPRGLRFIDLRCSRNTVRDGQTSSRPLQVRRTRQTRLRLKRGGQHGIRNFSFFHPTLCVCVYIYTG